MRLPTLLLLAAAQAACFGPIASTKGLLDAEAAVERARVAEAEERAPFEYNKAEHYLYKAKEEWGYSDFQASDEYAEQAERAAERALMKAKEDPWRGSPVPVEALRAKGLAPPEAAQPPGDRPVLTPDAMLEEARP